MATIGSLHIYGKKYIVSPQVEALLCNLLKINSFQLHNSKNNIVSKAIEEEFKIGIKKIYESKKLDPVIPYINFCDIQFMINDDVLLPHFETQEVVEQTAIYIDKLFNGNGKVIDLGCGSGVIGLTLKNKFKDLEVELIDISDKALKVAKKMLGY